MHIRIRIYAYTHTHTHILIFTDASPWGFSGEFTKRNRELIEITTTHQPFLPPSGSLP